MNISGNVVDIKAKRIYSGTVHVERGRISRIDETGPETSGAPYLLPGFIDAHVHVESSMVVPSEFARMAVVHGTVATVSDPHEIGNVLGIAGVEYMIANGRQVPFKFYFGAPSCVPATTFETAGATIGVDDVEALLKKDDVRYLAEMMNWPGVLYKDSDVMAKIALAQRYGKVVDGHAPGLRGEQARTYIQAGMSTDHECFTAEEALDKLKYGMKIIIREGSAARNFEALIGLLADHADSIMFCSDDKHPDSLEEGHINLLVRRAVAKGLDIFDVLKAACITPVAHYGLSVGQLRAGDAADFILVENLRDFTVLQTFIDGTLVAERGKTNIGRTPVSIVNAFAVGAKQPVDFKIPVPKSGQLRVIEAIDGQLVTNALLLSPKEVNGFAVADTERDILKIAVVNRYHEAKTAVAFIKNFGLTRGAIASSVGHDSHNILVVGVDDESIARAVNLIISEKGGVSAVDGATEFVLPLPVAGIMSADDAYVVAQQYKHIDALAKGMGSTLGAPFMTLSFMGLLVIPSLKLSDKGLFDGEEFKLLEKDGVAD